MQAKSSSRSPDEREDKPTQRALLALVLHEFPKQMTSGDLRCRGFADPDALARALRNLATAGLLWCEGDFAIPTLPARHFEWLELA